VDFVVIQKVTKTNWTKSKPEGKALEGCVGMRKNLFRKLICINFRKFNFHVSDNTFEFSLSQKHNFLVHILIQPYSVKTLLMFTIL